MQQSRLKFTTRYYVPVYRCLLFDFEIQKETTGIFSIILEQNDSLDFIFQLRNPKQVGALVNASVPLNVTKLSLGGKKFKVNINIYCYGRAT